MGSQRYSAYCLLKAGLLTVLVGLTQGLVCSSGRTYQTPPSVNRSDPYPFVEAGLQLFTGLVIPCDGIVTEWSFLPQSSVIYQLHLAVFRQGTNANEYRLIGETYIPASQVPQYRGPSGWVVISAEPPIVVSQGDVIGMYYDNVNTLAPSLSIVSKKLYGAEQDFRYPTFISLVDSTYVSRQRGLISVAMASVEFRVPALAVTVSSSTGQVITTESLTPPPPTTPRPTRPPTIKTTTTTTTTTTTSRPRIITLPSTTSLPDAIRWDTVDPQPASTISPRCNMSPTSALFCARREARSFYDYNTGICREYFGCPSISLEGNNFDSAEDCQRLCTAQKVSQDVCQMAPTALEVCYFKSYRYFYNPSKQACTRFYGCSLGGLAGNNFDSIEDCSRCKGSNALLTPINVQPSSVFSLPAPIAIAPAPAPAPFSYVQNGRAPSIVFLPQPGDSL